MRLGWRGQLSLGIAFLALALLTVLLETQLPEDLDEVALVPGLIGLYFAASGLLRHRVERKRGGA